MSSCEKICKCRVGVAELIECVTCTRLMQTEEKQMWTIHFG